MTIKELVREAIPEMRRLEKEGKSLREIACTLGVNYNTLQMYRREFGIPPLGKDRIRGGKHGNWLGGRSLEKRTGYMRVHTGLAYRYEHTVVAEEMIGRALSSREVVHHVNCDPTDNRPENLGVLSRSDHAKLHKQLEEIGRELYRRGEVVFSDENGYRLQRG